MTVSAIFTAGNVKKGIFVTYRFYKKNLKMTDFLLDTQILFIPFTYVVF